MELSSEGYKNSKIASDNIPNISHNQEKKFEAKYQTSLPKSQFNQQTEKMYIESLYYQSSKEKIEPTQNSSG